MTMPMPPIKPNCENPRKVVTESIEYEIDVANAARNAAEIV